MDVKHVSGAADSLGMIISEQQARLASHYIEPPTGPTCGGHPSVSPELMSRILVAVDAAPETRSSRVAEARARLSLGIPGAGEIAEKIIARTICDALR
jgi:hypothetical protein